MPRHPLTRPRPLLAALALGSLTLAACASEDTAPAADDGLTVVAGFYPLEYIVQRVAGDDVELVTLGSPGADPHDIEVTPRDLVTVQEADLVVYSQGFQPAVDEAVASQAADHALDVTPVADLIETGGAGHSEEEHAHDEHAHEEEEHDESAHTEDEHAHEEEEHDESAHTEDEHAHEEEEHAESAHTEDEHAHEEEEHADEAEHTEDPHADEEHADEEHADEEHAEDEHAHEGGDPHFWLDPERYGAVAQAVTDRLVELDPDNASTYEANAEALLADLEALDTEYTEALGTCERTEIVVSHQAFGYLADKYGLEQVAITGINPESEPSPTRLAEITAIVEEIGATTVYSEVLLGSQIAETVAAETGAQVLVLDPVEGITPESPGEDYLEIMRANLDALVEGQGCGGTGG